MAKRKPEYSDDDEDDKVIKKALICMDKAIEGKAKELNETDRYSIFGRYIACELREIGDAELERWARQKITTILCQAQSGNLPGSLMGSFQDDSTVQVAHRTPGKNLSD